MIGLTPGYARNRGLRASRARLHGPNARPCPSHRISRKNAADTHAKDECQRGLSASRDIVGPLAFATRA